MKAIGIDIGTTSICVVGYDMVSGAVTDSVSAKNEFLPGTFCQDPDRIVDAAKRLLQTMPASLGGADVIGVSSQMHGILYVNREGERQSPPSIHGRRNAGISRCLTEHMPLSLRRKRKCRCMQATER